MSAPRAVVFHAGRYAPLCSCGRQEVIDRRDPTCAICRLERRLGGDARLSVVPARTRPSTTPPSAAPHAYEEETPMIATIATTLIDEAAADAIATPDVMPDGPPLSIVPDVPVADDEPRTAGAYVLRLRIAAGLKRGEVAAAVNTAHGAIKAYEEGAKPVSELMGSRLARALGGDEDRMLRLVRAQPIVPRAYVGGRPRGARAAQSDRGPDTPAAVPSPAAPVTEPEPRPVSATLPRLAWQDDEYRIVQVAAARIVADVGDAGVVGVAGDGGHTDDIMTYPYVVERRDGRDALRVTRWLPLDHDGTYQLADAFAHVVRALAERGQ